MSMYSSIGIMMTNNFFQKNLGRWQHSRSSFNLTFCGLGFYAFILINDFFNWPLLQFARVVSPIKFRDTSWVLADADCYEKIGSGIYGLESETGCPGYLYGSSLLQLLNFLNIHEYHTHIFVIVMRAFFAIAAAYVVVKMSTTSRQALLIFVLISFSPGVQLMLYNANFDLLIFAMIVASHFAFRKNLIVISLGLIFLSGTFKFYTIPLLLVMAFLVPKIRQKLVAINFFIIASVLAVSDIKLMQEEIPSTGYAQFGLTVFTRYIQEIGLSVSSIYGFLLSLSFFIAALYLCFITKTRIKLKVGESDPDRSLMCLMLGIVFLSCFFTGLSYDPRLIYLSISAIIVIVQAPSSLYKRMCLALVGISSFLSCGIELGFMPKGETAFHPARVVQLLNDLAIEFLTAFLVLYLIDMFASSKSRTRLRMLFQPEVRATEKS